jgi:transcriptional regulator with XRE-family HTH domain
MSTESATGHAAAAPLPAADLARRVRGRRHALGLTIEEVATRARMDPGYVEMLEERPTDLTVGAMIRLADALDTTTSELLGARRAPGRGPAAPQAVLEPLGPTECLRLLESGGVGRVAATAGDRLVVLPVNYAVHDGLVVFRTSPSSVLARLAEGRVSFEIDRIDDGMRAGWSVLVSGPARVLTEPELHVLQAGVQVEPWAGGKRDLYIAVTPEEISGRRIHV